MLIKIFFPFSKGRWWRPPLLRLPPPERGLCQGVPAGQGGGGEVEGGAVRGGVRGTA